MLVNLLLWLFYFEKARHHKVVEFVKVPDLRQQSKHQDESTIEAAHIGYEFKQGVYRAFIVRDV